MTWMLMSVSSNFCVDKTPTNLNWIEGHGKSVGCDAIITKEIVSKVLKTVFPVFFKVE